MNFKEFLSEVTSAVNIPPEEREKIKELLKTDPSILTVKEILSLFRKYNEKEHKPAKWEKKSPVGGHNKKYFTVKKKPIKDPYI